MPYSEVEEIRTEKRYNEIEFTSFNPFPHIDAF